MRTSWPTCANWVSRGVKVRILTNSLASHDVPAVNSHYEKWREPILVTGAQLYELRSDAEMRGELAEIAPLRAEFVGLHTKAMVIDRQRAFIGSMNLDPRSEILNSEMGVIVDSPPLAEKLAERMLRDMDGANSWQVVRTDDGELRWRSAAGELTRNRHAASRSASRTSSSRPFRSISTDCPSHDPTSDFIHRRFGRCRTACRLRRLRAAARPFG